MAYSVCMMGPTRASGLFVRAMPAVIRVLQRSPDPWPHLVASLTGLWVEGAEWGLAKQLQFAYARLRRLSIAGRKDDILRAISNIRTFSPEQWCFVLSSIYALFVLDGRQLNSEEIRALIEILARLLQKGLYHMQDSTRCANAHTDFWLYVTMSVLDKETPVQHGTPMSQPNSGEILHA